MPDFNDAVAVKAGEIVEKTAKDGGWCAISISGADGYPQTSTITPAQADGIRRVTFCTGLASGKVKRIKEGGGKASVCFNSHHYNITLVGQVGIATDEETRRANWYDGMGAHMSGYDDPNFCVLVFVTERFDISIW